jgi:hypothetical protein
MTSLTAPDVPRISEVEMGRLMKCVHLDHIPVDVWTLYPQATAEKILRDAHQLFADELEGDPFEDRLNSCAKDEQGWRPSVKGLYAAFAEAMKSQGTDTRVDWLLEKHGCFLGALNDEESEMAPDDILKAYLEACPVEPLVDLLTEGDQTRSENMPAFCRKLKSLLPEKAALVHAAIGRKLAAHEDAGRQIASLLEQSKG